eukprot:GFUD01016907.1.p1 GENE.GFUD01016907.1~~GFUD01016907.1.p1  ORF type:complete len:876 (+),score=244.14 GFUD01016907.1:57-2684(+)
MSLNVEKNKENFVKFVYNDSLKNESPTLVNIVKNCLNEEDKSLPCFICGKSFSQKSLLSKHIKSHKANEGHECPKCSKRFVASRDLKKHVDIVHFNKGEEYKKECPICHARVQQLKTHIRFIHRNEGKNTEYNGVCPHCDKTFSNDYKVKRHIETVHEGVKHWQCTICPKKFYEKKDLGRHIRGVHMGEKVDTWRNKKTCNLRKIPSQVVVTKNILSTVDIVSSDPQSTLPINVLAEECEDRFDMGKEESSPESEVEDDVDNPGSVSEYDIANKYEEMEIDEVDADESFQEADLRFQVCDQRVDEDGNIVLEIIEKDQIHDSLEMRDNIKNEEANEDDSKMVTLRWGDTKECNAEENSPDKNENDYNETSIKSIKHASKVIDLNLRLEDIIHDSSEMSGEDFVLPEVVGDLPDWLLHGSNEIDILKMSNSGQSDTDLHNINKEDSESQLISPEKSEQDKQFDDLDEGTKTAFRCGACGKMFVSLEFLKNHIEKSHIQTKVSDDIDDLDEVVTPNKTVFKFRNDKNGARLAIPVDHKEEDGDIVEKLAIKELGSKESLKSKSVNEVLVCDIEGCEKTFSGKGKKLQYKRHVERIHLSIKNKQCPRCDLRFYEKRDLSRHIEAIHLRIRTICPIEGCARPVVRLDQHIKIVHTDKPPGKTDKSFKCPECGASFSRVYDMTRHRENVHRGYKNFSCDKCDRKFTDKRDLKRHHDAVHLNIKQTKVYSCNYCDKTFKFKKHLDSHRDTDHDGQNFSVIKHLSTHEGAMKEEPHHIDETDKQNEPRNHNSGSVVVTVNNINHQERADNNENSEVSKHENEIGSSKEIVVTGEEFNTVEIDGQLFLVQQTASGLSLLPVVQTSGDTLALTVEQVQAFAVEN